MTHNVTAGDKHSGQNVPTFIDHRNESWCPFTYKLTYNMQICAKLTHKVTAGY